MDRLPAAFADELRNHGVPIHLNHMLVGIDRTGERTTLNFQAGEGQSLNQPYGVGVPAPPRYTEVETDAVS
ncbi:MAG: hypothetical protein ACI9LU_000259 [Polaribacter sp.]|jgi:hypothetical protein